MSIYLDNSATTKIRSEALQKYIEVSENCFGNPSSLHGMGFLAEKELDAARKSILSSLGERMGEVIFTASGTEANNLAILGRAYSKDRYRQGKKRIITTQGEHASVDEPLTRLEAEGFEIVRIPTRGGQLDMTILQQALDSSVILVTMMMVNNETGALYDIGAVSKIMKAKSPEAILHVDATQSYLKIPFTKKQIGADMITVSSHKIEGPKGVGALVIDSSVIKARGITAVTLGGGQENGLRSGTENVPAIAAFGEAVRLGAAECAESCKSLKALRESLVKAIGDEEAFSGVTANLPASAAPHILNITLPNIKSETMLHFLSSEGIFVSSGSACSSNAAHLSSALTAFGKTDAEADCSIRISLSKRNTEADISAFLEALKLGLSKLARIKR